VFTDPVEKSSFQIRSLWTQEAGSGTLTGGTTARRRLVIGRPPGWLLWALTGIVLVAGVFYELETSALQSRIFPYVAKQATYTIAAGVSPDIVFPKKGPYDLRRGYSQIAEFQKRLEARGFKVADQSRFSPFLVKLSHWGITPPYRDSAIAGLVLNSAEGAVLHDARAGEQQFEDYDEIPSVVVKALLLIENRQLAVESASPTNNPVVEWNRLGKATLTYAGAKLGLPVRLEGGSTLATQLEKYLHAPEGRTESPADKLRQIISASLKAYRNGPNTGEARRRIVTEYLNSMPLAAVPGYGEVNGLGQGLRAWFGADLKETVDLLHEVAPSPAQVLAFRQVLTLLAAVRAPGNYLLQDREALEVRTSYYANLLVQTGLIDPDFGRLVCLSRVKFLNGAQNSDDVYEPRQKLSGALRKDLGDLLGMNNFYSLNQLDLAVKSTVDAGLQEKADALFAALKDPEFLVRKGFLGERLLATGDPARVIYSIVLYESRPEGNVLRLQTDSLDQPLDINEGIKMELGSTAKLRTLAHYLEIIASLYDERHSIDQAKDPLTNFVLEVTRAHPDISQQQVLEKALDRKYSASPGEVFFTGGGAHTFGNFDSKDNREFLTVREATRRSTNLVFIRLMRDLVRYHQARLPYDPQIILDTQNHPVRLRLLEEIAEAESKLFLHRAFRRFHGQAGSEVVSLLLGSKANSPRHLAILFLAWHGTAHADLQASLADWLESFGLEVQPAEVQRLIKAYGNPRLTMADYGYLLNRHPLDVWAAGELFKNSQTKWDDLWATSGPVCQVSSRWLFQPRNRRAQDLRLRIRVERDAFARMTPYWRRLGFPFHSLVPSYATAIGNSSDRPAALAELMGIIQNDGELRPTVRFEEMRFGARTPYHTVMVPNPPAAERVMPSAVARALRGVLAEVVEGGTARRISNTFAKSNKERITVGGKTGSGDNRHKSFTRGGGVIGSRAVNRTATFAFYIGDRYFGVVTAAVLGPEAAEFRFTSALPVEILKNLAPDIVARYEEQVVAVGEKSGPIS
jgi:membrane peptidoglycan carboxypeptidase